MSFFNKHADLIKLTNLQTQSIRIQQLPRPKFLSTKMNKLASLKQISAYRPKALSPQAHKSLSTQLKQFKLSSDYTYLKASLSFPSEQYNAIVDKMTIIGQIADTMDHHPEWTLKGSSLEIGLSTHECQGKVSIKDYVLATWIESIWNQKPLEETLIEEWNQRNISLDELK